MNFDGDDRAPGGDQVPQAMQLPLPNEVSGGERCDAD